MGGTITFLEALRFGEQAAFSLMVKPAGPLCNLRCDYCYYLDKKDLYGGKVPVMDYSLLETCLCNYFASCGTQELTVEWHGGEPLLAGKEFFRKAVELERKYSGGRTVHNSLQTNGTLLDMEWASFFRENGFLIGISLDGPEDIHNAYRHHRDGRGAFADVMCGLDILQRAGVGYNTMTTINRASEGRGEEVYRFLKTAGSRYMQFMPVYEYAGGKVAPYSVSPEAFGKYLCDIFDVWIKEDVGKYFVLTFDAALSSWCGLQPGICVFCESCGGNPVVEHNGDIYPCDHFVSAAGRLGNVKDTQLCLAVTSPQQIRFGLQKRNSLPDRCLSCRWLFACAGGCPKHRLAYGGENGRPLNSLCEGYSMFYSHISSGMERMKALILDGRAPSDICSCPKDMP